VLPAQHGSILILRLEEAIPDARNRGAQGSSTHREVASPGCADRDRGSNCGACACASSYGCNKIEKLLSLEGPYVSNVTIQKILIDLGLGSRYDRWMALERKSVEEGIALSGEQVAHIEKLNPSFKERHVESSGPGELLSQDTFFVGTLKGAGRIYMHTVIDTYGSFASAPPHDETAGGGGGGRAQRRPALL
jgi:hypothetical protein